MTPSGVGLKEDIEGLTDRVSTARVLHGFARQIAEGERAKAELERMSDKVLIKGLSEAVNAAKKSIAEAKAAPAALHASATALVATCADLKTQVDAMHEDIKFEASQLGNGGGSASS